MGPFVPRRGRRVSGLAHLTSARDGLQWGLGLALAGPESPQSEPPLLPELAAPGGGGTKPSGATPDSASA